MSEDRIVGIAIALLLTSCSDDITKRSSNSFANGSTHVWCYGNKGCKPFHKTDRFTIGNKGGKVKVSVTKYGQAQNCWVELVAQDGSRIEVANGRIYSTGKSVNLNAGTYVIDPELRYGGWTGRGGAKCVYFIHWRQN